MAVDFNDFGSNRVNSSLRGRSPYTGPYARVDTSGTENIIDRCVRNYEGVLGREAQSSLPAYQRPRVQITGRYAREEEPERDSRYGVPGRMVA